MHIKEKKRERPPFLLADILTFVPFYTFHFVPLPHSVNPPINHIPSTKKKTKKKTKAREEAPLLSIGYHPRLLP